MYSIAEIEERKNRLEKINKCGEEIIDLICAAGLSIKEASEMLEEVKADLLDLPLAAKRGGADANS